MKIADSHTHLQDIENENFSLVDLVINVGTKLEDNFEKYLIYPQVYVSYGIHPNHVYDYNNLEEVYNILKNKIEKTSKCVAIGETGLDFFYSEKNIISYDFLYLQLDLAKKLNKTVIIHMRNCDGKELIQILKRYNVKFVLHCFTYDLKTALSAIEIGGYISFSGILTFSKDLENVAKELPKTNILIETDAPYLTPHPYRGKKNTPKLIIHTLKFLSEIRKENIEEVADYTYNNTKDIFNIKL